MCGGIADLFLHPPAPAVCGAWCTDQLWNPVDASLCRSRRERELQPHCGSLHERGAVRRRADAVGGKAEKQLLAMAFRGRFAMPLSKGAAAAAAL